MSFNSFGHMLRVMTWGESHGPAIGCVVDGCPPLLDVTTQDIQYYLDRRKPGQSLFTTQRKEADQVEILSGVFEGKTTGTPISLLIKNTDKRSRDYSEIAQTYRPGHADLTYDLKYGIRDYRGGGRSSARETANRVAAGAIARKILGKQVVIRGALVQIGNREINPQNWDDEEIDNNPFFAPDREIVNKWAEDLKEIRREGDSIGAVVEVTAINVPAGLGAPVYGKLDSDLASAMMSINAVKAVEIGAGFEAARLKGSENADPIYCHHDELSFGADHAGGILGGISTGQPITVRFAVKPTSSILKEVPSITKTAKAVNVSTKGRHDPCVGIRAVPVGEAMMACVLADHFLRHRGQVGASQKTS